MSLKTLRIQLDEQVLVQLALIAEKLGVKPKPYVQLVLGQHVQEMLAVMQQREKGKAS